MIDTNGTIDPNASAPVEAYRCHKAGVSTVSIRPDGSKAPTRPWDVFQERLPTDAEMKAMFGRLGPGVATIMGKVSGGMEAIDFDAIETFEPWRKLVESESPGLVNKLTQHATPRGKHIIYRCDEISGNTDLANLVGSDGKRCKAIETRGEGGYILAPGCPEQCHPSGKTYEHIAGPWIGDATRITPAEREILFRAARALDQSPREESTPTPGPAPRSQSEGISPGDAFNQQSDWASILVPHGWSVSHTSGAKTFWRRPGKAAGWSSTTGVKSTNGIELFCCFTTSAPPFEGATHGSPCSSYSKFACYAKLNHNGDFGDAARALANANYGERSSKSTSTAQHIANGQQHHEPNETAPAPLVAVPAQLTYNAITMRQLDAAEYSIEYLIEGTLVAGQPCILCGGKKMLKTSLLVEMFLSLATTSPFLGRLRVERRVMAGMMSGESGMATLQETFRRVARAKGYSLADVQGVLLSSDLPRFGDIEHMDAMRTFIRENAIEVVGIDPAYLCMPGGDAGNLFIVGEMLRAISQVCEQEGCTLVLAHHDKKGIIDPYQPPELENIAWAGFQEFARQWILVGRRERYEPGTGEHRLWLNCGGSAGHSSLWALNVSEGAYDGKTERQWEVELMPAAEAREDADSRKIAAANKKHAEKLDRDKVALINAAAKFPNGETENILRDRAGLSGQRSKVALARALESGEIVPCEITKTNRTKPYGAYKLGDTSAEI